MLKIFPPTMLPIAMLFSPFLAATTMVTSSGNDVPIEITVTEMIFWLMPMEVAKASTLSTIKLLPKTMPTSPNIIMKMDLGSLYLGSSVTLPLSLSAFRIVIR